MCTKKFTVEDVKKAGHTLTPLVCIHCGSNEVVFMQYVGDGKCQSCGEWQTAEEEEVDE